MNGDSCRRDIDVVLVPGLWFGRPALWLLAWRLARSGLRVVLYRYRPLRLGLHEASERLARFAASRRVRHVVGYSYGGVVVVDFCRRHPQAYDRAVTLGAPFHGSRAARRLYRCPILHPMFGVAAPLLIRGERGPAPPRLGVVTGSKPRGLAACLLKGGTHDGVLRETETRLRGARDAVALPVSHAGLVMSRATARAIIMYLAQGRFGD